MYAYTCTRPLLSYERLKARNDIDRFEKADAVYRALPSQLCWTSVRRDTGRVHYSRNRLNVKYFAIVELQVFIATVGMVACSHSAAAAVSETGKELN